MGASHCVSFSVKQLCVRQSIAEAIDQKARVADDQIKKKRKLFAQFLPLTNDGIVTGCHAVVSNNRTIVGREKKHTNIRQTMKACNHIFGSINLAINFSKISSYTEIVLRSQLFGTGTSRIRSWLSIYSLLTTVCARVYVCVCVVCRLSYVFELMTYSLNRTPAELHPIYTQT